MTGKGRHGAAGSNRQGTGKPGAGDGTLGMYKYAAMSNLVLQADRRFVTRRGDENTGDPESIAGRITLADMGSRTAKEAAPAPPPSETIESGMRKRKRTEPLQSSRAAGVLSQADLDIEGLRYRPRTAVTKEVYDLIATNVAQKLGGDYGLAVTASATDSVLEYLKDENLKDADRKKEIDDILGITLNHKEFNQLVNLGKRITDYEARNEDDENRADDHGDDDEDQIDERQGVAVDFGDDDDDEDGVEGQVVEADSEDDELEIGAINAGMDDEDVVNQGLDGSDADGESMVFENAEAQVERQEHDESVLRAHEIDAFWLQREIGKLYDDPHARSDKTRDAEEIMSSKTETGEPKNMHEIENDLMELFDYTHNELVAKLAKNREKIIWVMRWRRQADDESARDAVEREMLDSGHGAILSELKGQGQAMDSTAEAGANIKPEPMALDESASRQPLAKKAGKLMSGLQPQRTLNLEDLKFDQGNHLMTNPKVKLPHGTTKRTFKGYEEIHVPEPKPHHKNVRLMSTDELPRWARIGFGQSKNLNTIQTTCYASAFESDENLLICAPTGSGKTNVAMLAMLREIGKHRDPDSGDIDLDSFKIIYIAPLKALVQEQVGNFGARLEPYGIRVAELTGDRQLTKQQIAETNIIVTTPEKWDVITRKATDTSYTNLVRLICIDEIHLLHDERGPVLESIVSRTIRRGEQTGEHVRIVGLSATLPNFVDVATFLRVHPEKGLFHFDGSFRPCPLKQEFIGITDKKAIKQLKTMNEICYKKVLEQVGERNQQVLIFVHSRKETAKTAKYIRDQALENDTIGQILRENAASREILRAESEQSSNADLKDILPYGFGIHHAGMSRSDRTTVEDLFTEGYIQVLVCTATLAWGVNLPAHTVIIKGTQIYSPEKGSWVELSPQDVLQMLGRAGRPQYDTYGEGIIITTQGELQYYLSLMTQQLPIESQFVSKLIDSLNAEIVLGNVRTRDEGALWLSYTYLYVRMIASPALYQVGVDYSDDHELQQKRVDLIHSAAVALEKAQLVKYDKKSGRFTSTELGRIASHYYITHNSMQTYNLHMHSGANSIELFRIFSLSEEFKYIPVRQDEKLELAKLLGRVPIPIKETIDEPQCKINLLLQAYVSCLKLEGLALMSDLVYITQSAGRILRAMFEIALKKGSAEVAKETLNLCKMAEKRMWPTMSPLRQFPECNADIIKKVERIDVPWNAYFDLDPPQMGELLNLPKQGRQICNMVARFPRLDINAQVQPITRSMLGVALSITPNFQWDDTLHGKAENWWIMVEDCDGEEILFHDQFLLKREYVLPEPKEHLVEFTVPISDPTPPHYIITVVNDRWLNAESKLVLSFHKLVLPEKFPAHTQLLDLQPLPVDALKRQDFRDLYPEWEHFNKIQTQTFKALYESDDSVFIGAPTGSGKTVCAEFAILRQWTNDSGKAVYIAPFQEQVDARLKLWQQRLGHVLGGKKVVKLTGESTADSTLLKEGDLILATPIQWDMMSRQWRRKKGVQNTKLIVADELHMLGGQGGYIYEAVISRAQAIAANLESEVRIVGLSVSLSNARDIGEWIGANKHTIFNFSPRLRPIPISLHLQGFTIPHFPSLMLAMIKPTYQAIVEHSRNEPAMVFLPNRKQVRSTAKDLLATCASDGQQNRFLRTDIEQLAPIFPRISETALAESLSHGIAYYHEALSPSDKRIVEQLFTQGAVQVMLVSRDCCWEIESTAHLVVVMGTQFFEGREHRYVDYPISEVLQMFGRAGRPGRDKEARGVLMLPAVKREYYRKFLSEALPIESQLQSYLGDVFVTEISTKTIESMEEAVGWSTYTYFYRRLLANPSFYGLTDTTHDGLSNYLSDQVEATLKELADANMIELKEDEDAVGPLHAAMIASHYNISFATMQMMLLSLKRNSKLKAIMEIVTAAIEFEDVPIRRHEETALRRIYDRVPVKLTVPDFESPHFKAFVLLEAHFSRMELPVDMAKDQQLILQKVLDILSASVDVLASEGHLNAMSGIEMCQMVVQAMWDRDSPLKQIPHFESDVVEACNKAGINDLFEFMDAMDPNENANYDKLVASMGLSNQQLADAAHFTNDQYPNVELNFKVVDPDEITAGEPVYIEVTVHRVIGEDEEPELAVHAPFYPGAKSESWYVVIGNEKEKSLLAIKKFTLEKSYRIRLQIELLEPGKHDLTLFLMSDSYVGLDQAPSFEVDVAEAMEVDEEEDDEDEESE